MTFRIIGRLDVKPPNLVKGIQLEGFRVAGDAKNLANRYYDLGIDELSYQDVVASLYDRSPDFSLIQEIFTGIYIPVTVGGGIRTLNDVDNVMSIGADKICLNSAALERPSLLSEISGSIGQQAVVLAIEAKRKNGSWVAMTHTGRETTEWDVAEWVECAQSYGVGEIVLTSVDNDGSQKGFDLDLINYVSPGCEVPLIAHGGAGSLQDIADAASAGADAVMMASVLHYSKLSISEIKLFLGGLKIETRI